MEKAVILISGTRSRYNELDAEVFLATVAAAMADLQNDKASRVRRSESQDNFDRLVKAVHVPPLCGRNAPCPCKSGRKYKKCGLLKKCHGGQQ